MFLMPPFVVGHQNEYGVDLLLAFVFFFLLLLLYFENFYTFISFKMHVPFDNKLRYYYANVHTLVCCSVAAIKSTNAKVNVVKCSPMFSPCTHIAVCL